MENNFNVIDFVLILAHYTTSNFFDRFIGAKGTINKIYSLKLKQDKKCLNYELHNTCDNSAKSISEILFNKKHISATLRLLIRKSINTFFPNSISAII
jgi:hypothetical protein